MELPQDFAQEVQQAWHRFLQRTEPLRPDLHRYCRALTGAVWDAEDLVQDTLLRAFAKLGEVSHQVDNPKAYLFRIASNLWVDRFRRTEPVALEERTLPSNPEQSTEVRDAAKQFDAPPAAAGTRSGRAERRVRLPPRGDRDDPPNHRGRD
jgi:RNA polymerase sigma factor (sigma-70 family)